MPFLVSYAGADRPWAHWIAAQLGAAGHEVRLIAADVYFATRIVEALSGPNEVILLLSAEHPGTAADWAQLPAGPGRLIALRLDGAVPPAALRHLVWHDLSGLDEEDALETLMAAVGGPRQRHPDG